MFWLKRSLKSGGLELRVTDERLVVVQVHAEYLTPETAVCSVFSRLKLLLRICGLLRRNVAAA